MKTFILVWIAVQLVLVANTWFNTLMAVQEQDTSFCSDRKFKETDRLIIFIAPLIFFSPEIDWVDELCNK